MVTIANPLDYHTFVWGNREKQATAFAAMMEGGYAINLVVLDFPRLDRCDAADWETTCQAVIEAARTTGARAGIVASLGENMPEATALFLMKAGIVPFFGIEEALDAIETAADIGAAWKKPASPRLLDGSGVAAGDAITLSEHEAKVELAASGLKVPEGKTAATAEEAAAAAETLGFPVVLKGLGVAHKTEAGAVKLNLASRQEVLAAASTMAGVASGYLVEKMVGKPVAELIIGAMRDPVAGPVLTIGAGGILVELLDDSAILTLPTTPEAIREAIGGLKIRKLLDGYRGGPTADFAALTEAVAAAASYVVSNASKLEELDINPLMVLPNGQGAVAADALIRRRK
jgi:acyl-CoA synthetase (NDP forming)